MAADRQLMKMEISLESLNLAQVSTSVCTKNSSHFFFISAVISCQELITVDENGNQPRELKLGTHITLTVCIKHPAQHFVYQLSLAINSCQQLSKTDENNIS